MTMPAGLRLLILDEEVIGGGVESYRKQLLPALSRQCDAVTLLVPEHLKDYFRDRYKNDCQLEVHSLLWPLNKPWRWAQMLARRFRFFWDWTGKARVRRIQAVARKAGCSHILTTCAINLPYPETGLPTSAIICDVSRDLPEAVRENIFDWTRKAQRVFVISQFTRNEIEADYPDATPKIIVTPLAMSHTRRTRGANALAHKSLFLYPASFNTHKGHLTLLKACVEVAGRGLEFECILIGGGTEWIVGNVVLSKSEREEVRQYYLQNRDILSRHVRSLGYVSDEEQRDWFGRATCVVLPSHYEGYGLPLAEALSWGVPLIVSDIPPFREQIDLFQAHERAVCFEAGNVQALVKHIEREIRCPRRILDSNEADVYSQRWTWDDMALAIVRSLNDPLNSGSC